MERKILTEVQAFDKQPLALAMVGDAVYTLFVRTKLIEATNLKVNELNKKVSAIVNAGAQAKVFFEIKDLLTDREQQVARRARNTNIHSHAKNYSIEEYIHATAFEALLGYLYLSGNLDRIRALFALTLEENERKTQKGIDK